ncbi:methionyl-tRNA formyltransferase, mitochondrial [Planococcus citri]|uniref:methionyl-tRNA formyltransferase, mitochondrial n=1 Tax=Planococcus citri TaxID=170843 RepID=UPI0031F73ADE
MVRDLAMRRVSSYAFKKMIANSVRSLSFQINKSTFSRRVCSHQSTEFPEDPPWRIMFFGSDDFAVKSLQALYSKLQTETLISRLDVTTTNAVDWKNEKNKVYRFAESNKLKIHPWPIDAECVRNKFDLGVVVSFGYLIPKSIIESFPLGVLNVHGSLLPKWRGAAPIVHAILNGDSTTGVTIMKIKPDKFDTGDIVRQYSVPIKTDETAAELTNRLAILGAQLLMECIRNLPRSVLMTVPQPEDSATYAKKIVPEMADVDWNNKSAQEIYNQYRALSHLFPLKTRWFDMTVKLLDVSVDEIEIFNPKNQKVIKNMRTKENVFPGIVEFSRKRALLRVQCKDGKWVCVREIIVSGKKSLSASEFYNGYMSKVENSMDRRFTDDLK